MKVSLNTIILFGKDVELVKDFYIDIFQFEVLEEIKDQWVLLNAGDCKIGLHKIGDQFLDTFTENFNADNNVKLVFEITTDIFLLQKELLKKGVHINEVQTWETYHSHTCDGKDPEGNTFQLSQRKEITIS